MTTFLLLVLVQLSSGRYDTHMYKYESMEMCLEQAGIAMKEIPAQPGISYSLTCLQVRATTEKPA